MLKKILILTAGIILFTLQAAAFGSYPSAQYPNVPAFNEKSVSGAFHVYVQKDGAWKDAGQIGFDKYFRQRTLDISSYAESGKTIKIMFKKEGGGLAHIDSVLLNTKSPLSASNRDADIKKFEKDDFDVADASGKEMEFEFSAEEGKAIISLTARIEEEVISKTPFQYPTANLYKNIGHNSKFYTYKIDSEVKPAEKEIFQEYSISGSGHPSGYTYGKVSNDKDNLYVTIDFTPDNTMDGDKDYAKVYVKTGALLREFKVTALEEKWGKANFTYTDNVPYEHKRYTFQIPLTEIGDAKEIEMAFSAYGTASPPGGDFGTATRQYLVVYDRYSGVSWDIYGQLVGEDGAAVGGEFIISNAANSQYQPSAAYSSSTNQYLVAWGDNRSGTADIYGQLVNANGSLSGGDFVISNAANYQSDPSVAYNSSTNQFLVAWEDSRSGTNDIYGQLINANGSLSGGNFIISNAANYQYDPSIAYNSSTNQFLVAWSDYRSGTNDIYGQLINANGSLSGGDFVISNAANGQYKPSVAYNSSTNQFLVAWEDYRSGTNDIYGQLINANGSLSGGNFFIQNNAYSPHAIANAFCPNYLITFWDTSIGGYSWTLYGEPCQSPPPPTCTHTMNMPTSPTNIGIFAPGIYMNYDPMVARPFGLEEAGDILTGRLWLPCLRNGHADIYLVLDAPAYGGKFMLSELHQWLSFPANIQPWLPNTVCNNVYAALFSLQKSGILPGNYKLDVIIVPSGTAASTIDQIVSGAAEAPYYKWSFTETLP